MLKLGLGIGLAATTSPIPFLFANGEQGAWFDLTDTSTWYQDAARTTPAATLGDVVGGIADKSGRGNHASQATTAQKPLRARIPLGGRRNMLTYTEDFSNAAWSKSNATATATKITENSSLGQHSAAQTATVIASTVYTASVELKAGERTFARVISYDGGSHFYGIVVNLTTGAFVSVSQGGTHSSDAYAITDAGDGYWRIAVTTSIASTFRQLVVNLYSDSTTATYTGDGTSGLFARNAQIELGSSATAYQKVVADWDVTESGVTSIPALYFDGSDDSLATAAIDFTGTSQITAFMALEKLSDAAQGAPLGLGNVASGAGTFEVNGPADAGANTYGAALRGNSGVASWKYSPYIAPVTNVLSFAMDLAATGDAKVAGRINGAAPTPVVSGAPGVGPFSNASIYLGRRISAGIPFKGYMIGHMVIVGKLANASEIAAVEATERAATGAY